jgi:hypothetical protein
MLALGCPIEVGAPEPRLPRKRNRIAAGRNNFVRRRRNEETELR